MKPYHHSSLRLECPFKDKSNLAADNCTHIEVCVRENLVQAKNYWQKMGPVDVLLEFIEVSIHNILFIRKLYPSSIFTLKKKYGVPVHVSQFPDLNSYISECLRAIKELIKLGQLQMVIVCFYDSNSKPVEKFVFNILKIQSSFSHTSESNDPHLMQIREAFRALSLKLSVCDSYLKPLQEGCMFQIHVNTNEAAFTTFNNNVTFEDFPWIELHKEEVGVSSTPKLLPVRAYESDSLHFEVYIESL